MAAFPTPLTRPDFGYPEKVSANAEKQLAAALASGDDVAALRAALNLTLAQNAIDSDRMPASLARLDSLGAGFKRPAPRAVCDLLRATIYADYYSSQAYAIDQRSQQSPASPVPTDYTEWNRDQFEAKISELLNAALANPEALQATSLRSYDPLLAVTAQEARVTYIFYPTLLDFIGNRAIDLMNRFRTPQAQALANEYRALLLRFNTGRPAPYSALMVNDILSRPASSEAMRRSLLELYSSLSGSEYSGEALISLGYITDNNNIDNCRQLKELIESFLHRYPSYIRAENLKSCLAEITRKRAELRFQSVVVPGNELSFTVKSYNTPSISVTLYKLPASYTDNGDDYFTLKEGTIPATLTAVSTSRLTFSGTAPFMAEEAGSVKIPSEGLYILVADAPELTRDNNPRIIRATHLAAGTISFGNSLEAVVVNPLTGKPVSDARIIGYGRRNATTDLGSTDSDGLLALNSSETGRQRLRPVKGSDRFAPAVNIWNQPDRGLDSKRRYYAQVFTDLALYHPGDTMRFSAILYSILDQDIQAAPGETVKAVLYDANRQQVDTLEATTDRFGRIEGCFELPDDGRLNGRYHVAVSFRNTSERAFFTVSDYKLPTFEVTIDPAQTDQPEKGAVTLSGRAMTYSGMPLADAGIKINVDREYLWRIPSGDTTPFSPLDLTATTDSDGRWSIVLTPTQLSGAGDKAWFSVSVTATSQAGESQAARSVFALGPSLRVRAVLPDAINIAHPVKLPVEVYGPSGSNVDGVTVSYTVTPENGGKDAPAIASGSFVSGNPMVDLSSVEPGTYTITFSIDGDSRSCRGIALYRPDVNRSPSDRLLWTPDNKVELSPGDDTDILLGTSMDSTWVLYTLYDYEKIMERRWICLPAGLHRITAATKRGGSPNLRASFVAAGRYTTSELNVTFRPAIDPRGLSLRAESMRDRIISGSAEKWTFSVVNALGTPVEAAVMVDMYNKALDAIMPMGWNLYIESPQSLYLSIMRPHTGGSIYSYLSAQVSSRFKLVNYSAPEFQLYGQTLSPQTWRVGAFPRQALMMKSMATSAADDAVEEVAIAEASMDMAPVNGSMAATAGAARDFGAAKMTEETAEAEEGESGSGSEESPSFSYRDAETALALFRPMLTTGRDGHLELSFTVPDANTTWAFQAIAFTEDMRNARFNTSVVASKPVMIKPNMPRFLREGDRASVLTSVMNATDSLMLVEVTIEIFDPATGNVISTATHSLSIPGEATEIVATEVVAPIAIPMLGFRAKASTPLFADGEQNIIPILAATARVVDSEPFYMSPDTDEATVILPPAPYATDATTTLEFCENPVWYVVTALPGLASAEPSTAPQAAGALFSAAVARGLVDRYPAIASALSEWTAKGADSPELTSMLERNADLASMLLQATPWMMDARSDSERMQRLALLFDRKRVDRSIAGAIDMLEKLQRASGGWAWIGQIDEPSQWATESVLSQLAALSDYGFLPDNKRLATMITKAVGYIDGIAENIYRKNPEITQTGYASLRAMFPSVKASATVDKILAAATQATVRDWKKLPLASRPEAAMLLWRRDYKSVAREILASMREFMVTTPDKGTYFPSLQNNAWGYLSYTANALRAFAAIEPGAPEIDGLRHWLVIQKQATDWGASAGATDVVSAILSSSSEWITDSKGASVKVNGKPLTIPATDRRLGYFRIPITGAPDKDVKVTVQKKSHTPAWGALMRSSVQPLLSVEAAGSSDLSIEKSIIAPDTLRVGDKATVRLVIRVGRNLNYVAVTDERAACFEPVVQLPTVQFSEGVAMYVEPRDSRTSIFVTTMPKGTYVVSYDVYVNNAGSFASGIAVAASQYAPEITARSGASEITVNSREQ